MDRARLRWAALGKGAAALGTFRDDLEPGERGRLATSPRNIRARDGEWVQVPAAAQGPILGGITHNWAYGHGRNHTVTGYIWAPISTSMG